MFRYRLKKGRLAVQAELSESGLMWLRSLRKKKPSAFKGGRITEILQLRPDLRPVGIVYDIMTGEQIGEPWKLPGVN